MMIRTVVLFVLSLMLFGAYAPGVPYPLVHHGVSKPNNMNKIWVESKTHIAYKYNYSRDSWVSMCPTIWWAGFNGVLSGASGYDALRYGQAILYSTTYELGFLCPKDGFVNRLWFTSHADIFTPGGDGNAWDILFYLWDGSTDELVLTLDIGDDADTTYQDEGWCGRFTDFTVECDSADVLMLYMNEENSNSLNNLYDVGMWFDYRFEVR
jgi:hypothetical protein